MKFALLLMSLLPLAIQGAPQSSDVLFSNVRVFDGEKSLGTISVLVSEGRIARMGKSIAPTEGCKIIDGAGKTLLPGLIDAHVHVFFAEHLRQAAVFGVTSVLDMMSVPQSAASLREQRISGNATQHADFYSAGAAVTVKGGHGTQFGFPVPTLDSADDAQTFVDSRIAEGSDYIKMIYEDGKAFGLNRPTLSAAMVRSAIAAAKKRGKLVVSHIGSYEGAELLISTGVDGLVHTFADAPVDDKLMRLAKENNVFIVPTLSVMYSAIGESRGAQLAKDDGLRPYLTAQNTANLNRGFPKREEAPNRMSHLLDNIRKLADAGVPILAGSDAPNPGTDHGVSLLQEIELLTEAGLNNAQALAAATSLPARYFSIGKLGRIQPGFRADLLLVEGDPVSKIAAIRKVAGVWKAGVEIDREGYSERIMQAEKGAPKPASKEGLISDFDAGTRATGFGAGWSESSDRLMGGTSTVELEVVKGGAASSEHALSISGTIRDQQPAFAGAMFSPGAMMMQPADLSEFSSLSFWAKGEPGRYALMLFTQAMGMRPSMKTIELTDDWQQFTYPISSFSNSDGSDIVGIYFGGLQAGSFKFQIDNVRLQK